LVALIMDSDHDNPLFRAPVKDPKNILDLGTGLGNWAMYVERKHLSSPRTTTHPLLAM
jgi:ubiquinone/menaquinone biosynthesis C-methylase UbiE